MKYSFVKSLVKAVKYPILILLGALAANSQAWFPEWANLTIGGLLILIYDFVKNKWGVRLP